MFLYKKPFIRPFIRPLISGALMLVGLSVFEVAAARSDSNNATYTAEQIYVFGDVHGAFPQLVQLLQGNGLIDANERWTGGRAHLVSLGDLVDRGAASRAVLDLLQRLQVEASSVGGRVHVVLGNHEVMNLIGDLRDVSREEFAAFADPAANGAAGLSDAEKLPPGFAAHREAFSKEGHYGRWLLSLPAMLRINNTVFTHAGLSPLIGDRSIDEINETMRQELLAAVALQQPDEVTAPLLNEFGPVWYRGSATCHPMLEEQVLARQLQFLNATRLVIGHTPTPTRRIRTRLNDRVLAIDTGMLASVYRGKPYLLLLQVNDSTPKVLDAAGKESVPGWWHPLLLHHPDQEQQFFADHQTRLLRGEAPDLPADQLPGSWHRASKKASARAVAQFKLDRELGLWMTPLTLPATDGKGYFQVAKDGWITERERRNQQRSFANHCVGGHPNLLLSAFDALTGVTSRSVDTILVHRITGNRRLAPVSQAFGTSTQLPKYASDPTLPPAMALRLERLTAERLQALLGDLLTPRQLRAVLTRRDKILQWRRSEPIL